MSIRLKLLITYILCVLLSAGILVISIFAGVGRFAKQMSEVVFDEQAPDQVFVEVVDIIAEIKQVEKYEPETLVDTNFIKEIDKRLSAISSSLVVVYNDIWMSADNYPEETLRTHLSQKNDEEFIMNGKYYVSTDFQFILNDEPVIYYILLDLSEFIDFNAEVRKGIGVGILFLIILMTLPLIVLIQKSIIKPLKQLDKGAKEISQGNLEFQLSSKANDEMGKVTRSYERMRQELKKAIEKQVQYENNRKELISSISHDLKTPMTSIKGYVEGILDGVANTPEKQERYLKVIHQKSLDMERMIDDLFTFSKLDLKKLPFQFEKVNAEIFIRDFVQEAAIEYSEIGTVKLTYINQSNRPAMVKMDSIQIRRVIQNLMQNSFNYNDADNKKVDIILENREDAVCIAVKDNGIGMVEEELKQVFNIFYRSDASRNTKTGGSGLGLAIVKQIIDGHDGKIKAASSKGVGTQISIILSKENMDE